MNGISDGVAVVTGAAGGIGRAAAERFAEEGARVVAADVDGLEVTVEEIESAGGEATAVETDVTDEGSVRALVEETEETYGVPDMAFTNAGIEGDNAPLAEQSIEDWDRTIAVNQTGVWLCLREELAAMADDGGGRIVNTASIAGLAGPRTRQRNHRTQRTSSASTWGFSRTPTTPTAMQSNRLTSRPNATDSSVNNGSSRGKNTARTTTRRNAVALPSATPT